MQDHVFGSLSGRNLMKTNTWSSNIITGIYYADWWKQLQEYNKKSFKDRLLNKTIPWFILTPATVKIVFSMSKYLEQPPEVRFLAVEFFDRFMTRHYLQLHTYVWNRPGTVSDIKHRHWDRVVERVRNQLMLRVMSCVQLASKLVSISKSITSMAAMNFLMKTGNNFTLQSIVLSERRVFQTLEFKLPIWHPIKYLEHLIERLRELYCDADLDLLYNISISVLDICYIQHEEIYFKLFHKITGRWDRTPKERCDFLAVECDGIFLTCAVIACAAELTQLDTVSVVSRLQQETKLPLSDIQDFSAIIMEAILSEPVTSTR